LLCDLDSGCPSLSVILTGYLFMVLISLLCDLDSGYPLPIPLFLLDEKKEWHG